MANYQWTDERKQQLRDGWAAGKTVVTLAGELETTKNSISGAVHRLNLERRPSIFMVNASRAAAHPKPPEDGQALEPAPAVLELVPPAPPPAEPPEEPPQPVPAPAPVPVVQAPAPRPPERPALPARELTADPFVVPSPPTCKWPMGDTRTAAFRYCGAPRPLGRSYCHEHERIARPGKRQQEAN